MNRGAFPLEVFVETYTYLAISSGTGWKSLDDTLTELGTEGIIDGYSLVEDSTDMDAATITLRVAMDADPSVAAAENRIIDEAGITLAGATPEPDHVHEGGIGYNAAVVLDINVTVAGGGGAQTDLVVNIWGRKRPGS